MAEFVLYPISESAVTLQFGSVINKENFDKVIGHCRAIENNPFAGFKEVVPAYTTLTIHFDLKGVMQSNLKGQSTVEKISNYINSLAILVDKSMVQQKFDIPVCYDDEFGLDLSELSKGSGLPVEKIIHLHASNTYTVFMIGFAPGFPYMAELPTALHCKRKSTPRKKVPAGSVAIAGNQTGIYPFETPGGWQIIGRTPLKLFDGARQMPSLLQAGMQIKFMPISREQFNKLSVA